MRLAQIMAGAPKGGAELFFERMTIALHESGQTVRPVIRTDARRAALLREAGLAPLQARFGGPLDLLTKPRLASWLRDFQAEIAIAWMSRAAGFLPLGDWVNVGRLGGYYSLKYFRRCRHLVGNTRGIAGWIEAQGWPAARVHYLPNFVADFAATAAVSRAGLGVPEDAALWLGLGRLHAVKGFDTLIEAAARVPEAFLVIAGEGPERPGLQARIDRLGLARRARLLGWREDSGALLKAADLFICSSRHEPLGNMVLEAWSAGCPVLAAKSEGPGETIRDGEDGLLVPLDDAGALADAARRILASRSCREALAGSGRARFEAEFSRPRVLAAWLEFVSRVRR